MQHHLNITKISKFLIAIAIVTAIWWLIAVVTKNQLFPTPWDAVKAFADLLTTPSTYTRVLVTTYRTLAGTLAGALVGIILGITTRYFKFMDTMVRVVIYPFFQSVPTVCWAFLFVIWFGLSDWTPILSVATAVMPFFIINVWEGLKDIDMKLVEMGSIYTRSNGRMLQKIIMPMLNPYVFAAIQSGVIVAWKIVILGEVFGSSTGMGYMLSIDFAAYHLPRVFAWTISFTFILLFFDKVFFPFIERKFIRKWQIDR